MNQLITKKLINSLVTAVFLVLVVGFSLLNQLSATAGLLPTAFVPTEFTSEPARSQAQSESIPSTSAPVITPTAAYIPSVIENVRHLLETNECVGCNLSGAVLKDTNLQAANLENADLQKADLEDAIGARGVVL